MIAPAVQVRESTRNDLPALESLYPAAFREEDLLPLVRQLVAERPDVNSIVAEADGGVVAHAAFSDCGVDGRAARVALLGPAAVSPDWQRRGLGGKLIRSGIERTIEAGFARVMVLGDPGYYRRFGFEADTEVKPPYELPEKWRTAWQSIRLSDANVAGTLMVPEPWRPKELWLP